jgi:hypothetical protein
LQAIGNVEFNKFLDPLQDVLECKLITWYTIWPYSQHTVTKVLNGAVSSNHTRGSHVAGRVHFC